jgi:uncharacterized protein (DUF1684 family)
MYMLTFFIGLALMGCLFPAKAQSDWFSKLQEDRIAKNEELKNKTGGPLTEETKTNFTGLRYYDPDSRYNLTAEFIRLKKPKTVWFATSDGKEKEYIRHAEIKFRLFGKSYSLYAYYSTKIRMGAGYEKHIFVPFKDLTNLNGTYGGGRYLDLKEPDGDVIQLDFNRAYNPYCAYSDGYSCPLVPKENYLNIAIEAGEKVLFTHEK